MVIPDELADFMIPRHGELPSASEAGATGRYLDRALAASPDLAPLVARAIAACGDDDPATAIVRLESSDRPALDGLATALQGAYFLNPRVRRRIGYRSHARDPVLEGEAEFDLEDDLLGPVVERGPIYTPTDGPS